MRDNFELHSKTIDLNKINSKIHDLGYTQQDIANKLDLDFSSVYRKLIGQRTITVDELVGLCRLLNLPLDDVIKVKQGDNQNECESSVAEE